VAPIFLTFGEILEIHEDQLVRYGGSAGIRDPGLLQSALAQPRATFEGRLLHADLFEMAAAYLFHLVQNHPFIDGNKRAGAVAALVFLRLNNCDIKATDKELESLVLSVAKGKTKKHTIAQFLRDHAK